MTPAINLAKKHKITHTMHEYSHDPASHSYGLEAVEKLGLNPAQVFKTLVVAQEPKGLAVAVVPVAGQLNLKAMAKALKVKKVAMAAPADVERSSGYVLGGVSPLGQKRQLPTVLDESAAGFATIFVSAGRRGLEIELAAQDLLDLTRGLLAPIAQVD
ncbi:MULTISPECIES: Cys-tRNA(Pro) deacylase [Zhongshania]|jgi:Cys-tRNA(Pro)/Cys-tRNA(Cys) deacylase|uniref:Cys-tRNA(Pro)/Cys-tRNA(Cys) deacylase n=1 Tax=Zhongshania antarctica TaxID=641702 RepID=A0A840QZZ3_9GAMM|nr:MULTISPECIES: Cys-tRNA(Pro) deacylase [Zhongshania]MBB5186027.1 Cys-tRNA(Pro)/Cys-tRNA(Cys) deacylase [Zhongshania antarctica]